MIEQGETETDAVRGDDDVDRLHATDKRRCRNVHGEGVDHQHALLTPPPHPTPPHPPTHLTLRFSRMNALAHFEKCRRASSSSLIHREPASLAMNEGGLQWLAMQHQSSKSSRPATSVRACVLASVRSLIHVAGALACALGTV